jgi:manganese/zinc/iron transport system substrate-binding protein
VFVRLRLPVATLLLAASLCAGCGPAATVGARKKVVTTTTGMMGDLIKRVARDTVELIELMGPGIDPHLYKPKESAIRKLFQADLILYSGLHLEGKMARLFERSAKAHAAARDPFVPPKQLLEDEGAHDPHIWFDVSLWAGALDAVTHDLCELNPDHATAYRARAARYRAELLALHQEVKDALATVPKARRVMVTAHDAFRYFGRAYDVDVVGLQGVSTANQAGLRKVQDVVDTVVSRGVKALFVESSVPDDGVKAVLTRCQGLGHTVRIAEEELFSDAMGPPGTPEGTYVGMIRHNVRVIVDALK